MKSFQDPNDLFPSKKIWNLLLPLVAESILLSLMGMMDTLMVTSAGEAAVSAVSLVNQLNNMIVQLFSALSVGGSVVVSQLVGARQTHEARQCARQLMQSIMILSLLIGVICAVFRARLIGLIYPTVESDVRADCLTYLYVTAISYPFLAVGSAATSVFRVGGNSKTPMIVNIAANLLNVGGNAWLIYGMKLGVLGAALPTLASRVFSAVVLSLLLRSRKQTLYCRSWFFVKPNFKRIGKMMSIGIPAGIENSGFELGKLLVSSVLSREGTAALAANALEITFEAFSSQVGNGVCMAAMIVVGTCVGAGRYDEVRRQVGRLAIICKIGTILLCMFAIAIARPVAALTGLGSEATELFVKMNLFVHIGKMIPFECFLFANALRGAGDVKYTMVTSLMIMWGIRVALSIGLELFAGLGVISMWIGMITDWVARFIVFGLRLRSGKWIGKSVVKPAEG